MSIAEIPLSQGLVAVIDSSDLDRVLLYKWCATIGPWGTYATTNITAPNGKRTMMKLHRFLVNATEDQLVDHHDHNGLNNRRENLRVCNTSQNGGNSRLSRRNSSGYKGVAWHRQRNKWVAHIMVNRKQHYLGLFSNPWEAAQAYNSAARAAWGEFAHINAQESP